MIGIQIQEIQLGEGYKIVRYQPSIDTSPKYWHQSSSDISPAQAWVLNWSCFPRSFYLHCPQKNMIQTSMYKSAE